MRIEGVTGRVELLMNCVIEDTPWDVAESQD
jgi:hypothetical protein